MIFLPIFTRQMIIIRFFIKKIAKHLVIQKKALPLYRYPENNLFTLKKTNTY